MSEENVKKIIGRAVTDAAFRGLLFSRPDEALAGYDLTDDEIVSLKNLPREQFDSTAIQLEERVSRAGIHLGDVVGGVLGAMGTEGKSVPGEDSPGEGDVGGVGMSGESEGEPMIPACDGSSKDEAIDIGMPAGEEPVPVAELDPDSVTPDMKFIEPEGVEAHEGLVGVIPADEPGGAGTDEVAQAGGALAGEDELGYMPIPLPRVPDEPGGAGMDEAAQAGGALAGEDELGYMPIPLPRVPDEPGGAGMDEVAQAGGALAGEDELGDMPIPVPRVPDEPGGGMDFKFIEPEDVEVREAFEDLGGDMADLDGKGGDVFLDGKGGDIAPDM